MTSKLFFGSLALTAAVVRAQVPTVSGVTFSQDETRAVTIHYTITEAPGIVTLDVRTNGTSIGAENITYLSGDVNKLIPASSSSRTITWLANKSWPDHKIIDGSVSVRVTAWAVDTPPDYLVVDMLTATNVHYYTCAEALPDGGLSNDVYKTSRIVMRKVPAKGVTWAMGNSTGWPNKHSVSNTEDYYIGIYPVTQGQWTVLKSSNPSSFVHAGAALRRPVETVSYNLMRSSLPTAVPTSDSFLGLLRKKTGVAFDLPTDAQWEYACRAGHGDGEWGDGSLWATNWIGTTLHDDNLDYVGRYKCNGGYIQSGTTFSSPATTCGPENGSAIVGSYRPNSWGIYDMHGNVWETLLDGDSSSHVLRGGAWSSNVNNCYPYAYNWLAVASTSPDVGLRVAAPVAAVESLQ